MKSFDVQILFFYIIVQIEFLQLNCENHLNCSGLSNNVEFPDIYASYVPPVFHRGRREYKTNNTFIEIPNTLNSLQLTCSALFPVQWSFKRYPPIAWDISTERVQTLINGSSAPVDKFLSKLTFHVLRETVLENRYPTCFQSSNRCIQTSINATVKENIQLLITKGSGCTVLLCLENIADVSLNPTSTYGGNPGCNTLLLGYDEAEEKFYCQSTTGDRPVLYIQSCSDPTTCYEHISAENCNTMPNITISECSDTNECRNATIRVNYLPAVALCFLPRTRMSVAMPYFYSYPILSGTEDHVHNAKYRYFNWDDAPKEDMLDIVNLVNHTVYADQEFTVSCNGSYYYFASGLKFRIQKENESASEVVGAKEKERVSYVSSTRDGTQTAFVLNHTLTLKQFILHQPGKYEIICSAPVWNSTEWVSKSTSITILESQKPIFFYGNMPETLYYKPNKEIPCAAFGVPTPNISWLLDGNPLPTKISQVPGVQNETESWRNLIFPNSPVGVYGNFVCIASNVAGSDEKSFILLQNDSSSSTAVIVIAVFGVLSIIIIPLLIYLGMRIWKPKPNILTQEEVDQFLHGKQDDTIPFKKDMNTFIAYFLPYDKTYELSKESLVVEWKTILGEGNYGIVYLAQHVDSSTTPPRVIKDVAVKTMKPDIPDDMLETSFKALLSELKILSFIGTHENIVNLEGACTVNLIEGEVLIATELCENGSLLEFIKLNKHSYYNPVASAEAETSFTDVKIAYVPLESMTNIPLNNNKYENVCELSFMNLLRWSKEIADGMAFLTSKKVIHGDLAARNVLLTRNLQAKISDFGLSKKLLTYCSKTINPTFPLPLPWVAIECIRDLECSIESDIWSYGITLWEIFSLGKLPYADALWSTLDFEQAIYKGRRLSKPIHATTQIYEIMMDCWKYDRKQRPKFSELSNFFSQYLRIPKDYVQVHPTTAHRSSQEHEVSSGISGTEISSAVIIKKDVI